MADNIPPKPPDPNIIETSPALFTQSQDASIERRERPAEDTVTNVNKKTITDLDLASASIQTVYSHPCLSEEPRSYGESDCGPFIVHFYRLEPDSAAGLSIRPIKVGQFLAKNNVKNIVRDGIKSVGRNRVAIEFNSASDANNFIVNPVLFASNYRASIPTYNVTRMGIVRGVPVDLSMKDFVDSLDLPENCGKVLKARRINRKQSTEGKTTWTPTQTVVLTFEGQVLPKRLYCYHTSLIVETYLLPTIQCHNCCRFGHIKIQCRSKPRCFRCAQDHTGDSCAVSESNATCLYCSGRHFATDKCCTEFSRQKSIKLVMSEENVSYSEASARFAPVRRPYADVARTMTFTPTVYPNTTCNYSSMSTSYRKTVTLPPRNRSPLPQGYNKRAHQNIINDLPSSLPNGCALQASPSHSVTPNDNLLELILELLTNIMGKWNDVLPSNVADKLADLFNIINNKNGSNSVSTMEQ